MMPVEYINRKNESHYLKAVPTKSGKQRYYIVKDKSKVPFHELIEDVPPGFELYEFPEDARVVLRKKLISNITLQDMEAVDQVMRHHETIKDYLLDKEANAVLLYKADPIEDYSYVDEELYTKIKRYWPVLRFGKKDADTFTAQRFCSLSRYYGWITMETSNDLYHLAEKYCYHADKESLLEFWIEGEEDW